MRTAATLYRAGKLSEASNEAAQLFELITDAASFPTFTFEHWYDCSRFFALASGKTADKKRNYGDRAMELLHKAVRAGYKDAAHMKKDNDLDLLRDRSDFKKLLAELQMKNAPKNAKP